MSVKEKDNSVFNMLQSERDRCVLIIEKISIELEKLPKGSLGHRKVKSNGKEYTYPCLRYRNGSVVKFEHLAPEKVEGLKLVLERRRKLLVDLKANRKRVATLNAIIPKDNP
jgi:hypothetical protein